MDVWVALLAALGPALGKALYDVGKEVVKPLTGPLAEQVEAWARRGYDAKVDGARVRKAVEAAARTTGLWEGLADHYRLTGALHRLAERGQDTLRQSTVAVALAMTEGTPEEVPDELLKALDVDAQDRPVFARFLWAFRDALAQADEECRALVELAHQDAVRDHLRSLASTVVQTPAGPAQRVVLVEPEKPADELRVLWAEYMAYLVNTYRRLNFRGIVQTKTQVELPLAEVYVSLSVGPSGGGLIEEPGDVIDERTLRERAERAGRLSVEDVLREEPRLVVLGDPGAGKTTFLRYVALALAEGERAAGERLALSGEWLPVYLPLAAYNEALRKERVSLEDHVLHYWDTRSFDRPGMDQLVAQTLGAGKVLLLLDGLDEVGSRADRLAVARQVEAWANSYGSRGNRVVVSSRVVGYDEAPLACDFHAFTLNPFGPEEIGRFAHQWCVAYQKWANPDQPEEMALEKGRVEAAQLVGEIHADPKVESLASNPLLVTIIALIHYKGTRLPDHRVELYDLCIQTLVETWREARSEAGPVGRPLRVANEIKVLAPFALWLQREAPGPGGAARRAAVRARLVDLIARQFRGDREAAETEADLFLELGQRQTGLLVERGEGWFGFFHPTFKEYLAARACVLEGQIQGVAGTWEVLRPHLGDALWHEVILLTVGYKAIMDAQDEAAAYLVRRIAAAPGGHGENVVLAGRCLADVGHGLVPDDCWDEIVEKLIPVMQDLAPDGRPNVPPAVPIPTRYAAGEVLDRIGWLPDDLDTWVEVNLDTGNWKLDTRSEASSIEHPASAIWVAKYPVTNHQFARFIAAGGYENPGYWGGEESAAWRWRTGKPKYEWQRTDAPDSWDDPRFGKSRRGYPVVGVSWYEANAYCAWLTEELEVPGFTFQVWRDGELETLNLEPETLTVRLLTETEWVAAAGGERRDRYPWGPKWHESRANTGEGGVRGTTPVAMYPSGQSSHGVWDMGGNVWEWMTSPEEVKPLRGGSWLDGQEDASVRARSKGDPGYSVNLRGFRVVASPAGSNC
jgi:formylglycine-generating enzyme required for sulfatase activity